MQDRALTRREREIMDILFRCKEASAKDVHKELTGSPSYSTVRALLRRLEEKGLVTHRERELRYVYAPVPSRSNARRSAIERLVTVFYDGSVTEAVMGLVDESREKLSDEELDAIETAIAAARARARGSKQRRRS